MDYYCDICLKNIQAKNKYKHFKSKSHTEFENCKHITLSYKDNIDINDKDEAFSLFIIEHKKKFVYYLLECGFILVFNNCEYSPYVMSNVDDKKTLVSFRSFLVKVIHEFKYKGYTFNHIAEMHIITIAKKMDMSYDFYIKHTLCALERKLNAKFNENKSLINKSPRNWRHPLNRKIGSSRV